MSDYTVSDIRVVISVDFGTTFSGFAYAHLDSNSLIRTQSQWPSGPRRETIEKVPTILEYEQNLKLKAWGLSTLQGKQKSRASSEQTHLIELFKLHLAEDGTYEKMPLPAGLGYKKAITDFLREMGKEIKETVMTTWPNLEYPQSFRFVVTVPVEWSHAAQQTMRRCCHEAGFIDTLNSENLQFMTEPEAAALHCRELIDQYNLQTGDTFMIVDCGGGTVDLTTRTILKDRRLSETTESKGECCGGSYVDNEFIDWLARKTKIPSKTLRQSSQCRLSIRRFFWPLKSGFDGKDESADIIVDLDREFKFLKKLLSERGYEDVKEELEDEDWCLELDFESFKAMFDPSVDEIIRLIRNQLEKCPKCKAIFLVGGYSENKYLQTRIKETFEKRTRTIAVPESPITAVLKGAAQYGLSIDNDTGMSKDIHDRVLKFTYGTDILTDWQEGDPEEKRGGKVKRFSPIARRGDRFELTSKFSENYYPVFFAQRFMKLDIYYTDKDDAKYLDEARLLHEWKAKLPEISRALDRSITISLMFGHKEIKAQATSTHIETPLETEFNFPE